MIRLTDEQGERIRDHFSEENIADGRPGRKPIPTRCVLEAVLWILNTGAQWHMLPQSYPNYKTVHRRFQTWCRDEVLRRVLTDVANELRDRGALNEEECFIDATFVMAKGGGSEIGATKRDMPVEVVFAATEADSQKILDLLARESLSLFYIRSPCEFGHVGE
jgi:transposase